LENSIYNITLSDCVGFEESDNHTDNPFQFTHLAIRGINNVDLNNNLQSVRVCKDVFNGEGEFLLIRVRNPLLANLFARSLLCFSSKTYPPPEGGPSYPPPPVKEGRMSSIVTGGGPRST